MTIQQTALSDIGLDLNALLDDVRVSSFEWTFGEHNPTVNFDTDSVMDGVDSSYIQANTCHCDPSDAVVVDRNMLAELEESSPLNMGEERAKLLIAEAIAEALNGVTFLTTDMRGIITTMQLHTIADYLGDTIRDVLNHDEVDGVTAMRKLI